MFYWFHFLNFSDYIPFKNSKYSTLKKDILIPLALVLDLGSVSLFRGQRIPRTKTENM
jgi:hypothetical protein